MMSLSPLELELALELELELTARTHRSNRPQEVDP
jgi:hypothetical protein